MEIGAQEIGGKPEIDVRFFQQPGLENGAHWKTVEI